MEASRPRPSFQFEKPPHIMIIEARFYNKLADMQLEGARGALESIKATHEIITVPGALEIPAAVAFVLKSFNFDPLRRRPDGYVALGCVIKGGTMHDEIVGTESARGLQDLAITRSIAVGNGILTCNTIEQAEERADPKRLNRGREAAEACLRMIELKHQLRLNSQRRWKAQ